MLLRPNEERVTKKQLVLIGGDRRNAFFLQLSARKQAWTLLNTCVNITQLCFKRIVHQQSNCNTLYAKNFQFRGWIDKHVLTNEILLCLYPLVLNKLSLKFLNE